MWISLSSAGAGNAKGRNVAAGRDGGLGLRRDDLLR